MKTTVRLFALLLAALGAGCSNDQVSPGTRPDCEGVDCFVVEGPGVAGDQSCGRYLSCLLATQPAAYGAAIQLYGEGSACWQSDAQRAGCNQACEASFDAIATACVCSGASCTKCEAPEDGYYRLRSLGYGGEACSAAEITSATLTTGANRVATLELTFSDAYYLPDVVLSGTLSCDGPSTLTGAAPSGSGCTRTFTAVVDRQSDGRSILVHATRTNTCQGQAPDVCSGTVLLEK
jgi:hypothetical protein